MQLSPDKQPDLLRIFHSCLLANNKQDTEPCSTDLDDLQPQVLTLFQYQVQSQLAYIYSWAKVHLNLITMVPVS